FQCTISIRQLHYFPTRRSSDLTKARIELGRKQYAKAESLLERNLEIYSRQPFRATPLLSPSLTLLAQAYSENGEAQKADEKFNEDRKSTRLNSSHVSISYAVFC